MKMVLGKSNREGKFLSIKLVIGIFILLVGSQAFAQDTAAEEGTGVMKGTVASRTGDTIAGAQLIFTDKNTGKTAVVKSNADGTFASGNLAASDYNLRVEAKSFITQTFSVSIKAGEIGTTNVRLAPEPLPGIVPTHQVDLLPVRQLNFLEFSQLEPGVENHSAAILDPSKNAFSSVSWFDRTGAATPIFVDGLSLTDRTSGSVTQNVPPGAAEEFQFGGLLAPIDRQFYAPGAVNFISRSGSDELHGSLFGFYGNGDALSASLAGGHNTNWGRQQYGGEAGGALVKNKTFFFLSLQRNKLDAANEVLTAGPFQVFSPSTTTVRVPFRGFEASGRVDYDWSESTHAFYRFGYDQSSDVSPFPSGPSLQPLRSETTTPSHTVAVDWKSGESVHAFRFEYLRFHDSTSEPTGVLSPLIPNLNFNINIGGGSANQCGQGALLCLGPTPYSNQQNYQSDMQFRYDGSRVFGRHQFHFGGSYDNITVGRFDPLYSVAPALSSQSSVPLPFGILGSSGLATDPLAYPTQWAFLGNGRGAASEKSAFGLPAGGLTDHAIALYGADTFKVLPNLSVSYGLHWVRDTVPNNSDLPAIPPLNAFQPKLGNKVRQPNLNFAPQLGVAWDPDNNGKTLIRGGAALFYDNSSFKNAYLDRPLRLQQGTYLTTPAACVGGMSGRIQWPTAAGAPGTVINNAGIVNSDGTVSPYDPAALRSWCGESMNTAGPRAIALQQAYQAATAAATSNPSYIGNRAGFAGPYQNGLSLLGPNYQTPRTLQTNVGMRHELRPGMIFTVDYVRQVTTRTLLGVDTNHGGAAETFNRLNAISARDLAQTNAVAFGGAANCSSGSGQINCMLASFGSAARVLDAYGAAGIGGPAQVTGGAPCLFCAFPGDNQNLGVNIANVPAGRSVYNGFNAGLSQQITGFSHGVRRATFQFLYTRSSYKSQGEDSGFSNLAPDYGVPDRFTGPSGLERKSQYSFGAFLDLSKSFQFSFLSHFASSLPLTLRYQQTSGGAEVLVTDFTGDGSTGDVIPGSNVGSYMRDIQGSGLRKFIANYNATFPNSTTPASPAGNQLINAGVFTLPELQTIGGVLQPLASPIQDVAGLSWLKTFDLRLGWEHRLGERVVITPSVSAYNVFNFANFDLPGNTQNGVLNFGAGSTSRWASLVQPQNTAGGVSPNRYSRLNRATLSGMNAAGVPRAIEWGVKIAF